MLITRIFTLSLLVMLASNAIAATHIGFRGDGSGVFPDQNPPLEWDGPSGTNILWRTEMPGISSGSPIVVAGKVFTLSDPDWLLCHDADSGKELWRRLSDAFADKPQVRRALDAYSVKVRDWWYGTKGGSGLGKRPYGKLPHEITKRYKLPEIKWPESNYSLATPVSDGQAVFVHFATGAVACYEFDGSKRWQINLAPRSRPAEGPSGLVVAGVFCTTTTLQGSKEERHFRQHHMLGLDVKTGEERWRTDLMPGPGGDPSSTPSLVTVGDRQLIVSASGYVIDPRNGQFLATKIGISGDGCSAVPIDNTIYFLEGGGKNKKGYWTGRGASTGYAVTLSKEKGKIIAERGPEVQFADGRIRTYASPLIHNDRMYVITFDKFLIGDLKTGKLIPPPSGKFRKWLFKTNLKHEVVKKMGKLDRNVYASPILVGDLMYVFHANSSCAVIKLGDKPKRLHGNNLAMGKERIVASPFVYKDRIYVRTMRALYCIGRE